MPLDPVLLKYNQLKNEDPEAAEMFAQQNGIIPTGRAFGKGNLPKIGSIVPGLSANPQEPEANGGSFQQAPQMAPSIRIQNRDDFLDEAVNNAKNPQNLMNTPEARVMAMKAAIGKMMNRPHPEQAPQEEPSEEELNKKRLKSYPAMEQ